MPNRVNQLLLNEYTERYKDAEYLIAVGYEGLNVDQTDAFRTELFNKGLPLKMVKNRIASIAFKELGLDGVDDMLKGQTAFVQGEDPVAMARTIKDFAKEHKQVVFRGAIIEGSILDDKGAKGLADAASKEELQARVVGAALSGGANLAGALKGPASVIAGCIESIVDKLEKESA